MANWKWQGEPHRGPGETAELKSKGGNDLIDRSPKPRGPFVIDCPRGSIWQPRGVYRLRSRLADIGHQGAKATSLCWPPYLINLMYSAGGPPVPKVALPLPL